MQTVTFIHCADLHLDSPFKGLSHLPENALKQVRQSTFQALDQLVEQAIHHQVDFVLMVGDMFDQEDQSMRAHMAFRHALQRLKEHEISVYLSFANHDYLKSHTFPHHYPSNVYWFDREEVQAFPFKKEDQLLAQIYGFSYENRTVSIDKSKEYQKTADECFHIGMLHGSKGDSEHMPYAPFSLQALKQKGFDYWALGHIHKREVLSAHHPAIVYPGNMQGRSSKETGEKGCYLVTLTEQETICHFLPLAPILFEKKQLSLTAFEKLDLLADNLFELVTQARERTVFIQLAFDHVQPDQRSWFLERHVDDMIEYVNEQAQNAFLIGYKWREATPFNWQDGGAFMDELAKAFAAEDITEVIQPITSHIEGKKWVHADKGLNPSEITREAAALLARLLRE